MIIMNATKYTVSEQSARGERRNSIIRYTNSAQKSKPTANIAVEESSVQFRIPSGCIGCSTEDTKKFYECFTNNAALIPRSAFTLPMFFNWYDNLSCTDTSIVSRRRGTKRWQYIRFGRTAQSQLGDSFSVISGFGKNKTDMFYDILRKLFEDPIVPQMDASLTPDGSQLEIEEKATTTVVAISNEVEVLEQETIQPLVDELCNSSLEFTMPTITDRFEILKKGEIRVGTVLKEDVLLPRDLFALRGDSSANLTLFSDFIYSKLELEIQIVVTAPKFGQGKLIASWFPDPVDSVQTKYDDAESLLMRPHVIMDLNTGNSIVIRVPQQIRRGFLRNVRHESSNPATAYAAMACLQLRELSPYLTGQDQPLSVPYIIYYRFVAAKFAGISYPVVLQGNDVMPLLGAVAPEITAAEAVLKQVGFLGNRDKPYYDNVQRFVPTPRLNFSSGVGVTDSIPLSYDHKSTMTILSDYINPNDPVSIPQLATRWGLHGNFEWSHSNRTGDMLYRTKAMPLKNVFGSYDDGAGHKYNFMQGRPTPIAFAASMFAFFRGSIDFRFTVVGTPFHTGVLQVTVSYGRLPDDMDQSESAYTYNFDLGEQREFDVSVPYIYDTPLRRTNNRVHGFPKHLGTVVAGAYDQDSTMTNSICGADLPLSIEMMTNTFVTVRVANPLTPISNVSAVTNVLVYIRGGSDFQLVSPVPTMYSRVADFERDILMKPFPVFDVVKDRGQKTFSSENVFSFDYVVPQAFETNTSGGSFHSTDTDQRFKTLMRRNVKRMAIEVLPDLYNNENRHSRWGVEFYTSGRQYYMIPVYMPNHVVRDPESAIMLSSPHSAIMTMFRHWRGSIQFTIVVEDQPDGVAPVYVCYIPNMGTTMRGVHSTATYLNKLDSTEMQFPLFADMDFAAMGFATEVLLPGVNPSLSITAPFDCVHNQCVNTVRYDKSDEGAVFMARDDATLHSGHLAIWSRKKTALSVFTSIGDDFEMSNFIGTPYYKFSTLYTVFDDLVRDKNGNITGTTKPPTTANPGARARKATVNTGGAVARGVSTTTSVPLQARIAKTVDVNYNEQYRELKKNVETEQRKYDDYRERNKDTEQQLGRARQDLQQLREIAITERETHEAILAERRREEQRLQNVRNAISRAQSQYRNRSAREIDEFEDDPVVSQNGDFEEIPSTSTPKKKGALKNFVQMGSNISKLRSEISDASESVIEEIVDLSAIAKNTIGQLGSSFAGAAERVELMSEDFHKTTQRMDHTMDTMASAVEKSSTAVEKLAGTMEVNLEKSSTAIEKIAETFDDNMNTLASTARETSESVQSVMDTITKIVTPFADSLTRSLPPSMRMGGFSKLILNTLIDIYTLTKHFDWDLFALYVLRFLAQAYDFAIGSIMQYLTPLVRVCQRNFLAEVVTQAPDDGQRGASSLVGFFTSVLATGLKYKIDKPRMARNNVSAGEFIFDNKTISFANGTFVWFERCFRAILAAGKWVLDKISPPVETAIERLRKKNDYIANVLDEIDVLMNPANAKVLSRGDNVVRIWRNYMVAKAIYKDFALLGSSQAAAAVIARLTTYIKWVEESWARISTCPVRIEPFVLAINGPSDAGKSFLAQNMGSTLVRKIGVLMEGGNCVYTRAPGKNFWDAYVDQEVILFDDWMNLTDTNQMVEQLADLFELKSPADFMPEKASLSEKGVKANPRLVMLVTNQPFPSHVKNISATPEAVWRRRDSLIHVKPNLDITGGQHIRSLDPAVTKDFGHLLFCFGDPRDPAANTQDKLTEWVSYDEMMERLSKRFVEFSQREYELAQEKLKWFTQDLPQKITEISNPMDIFHFRKTIVQEKYNKYDDVRLPSYLLDKQVDLLAARLDELTANQSQGPGTNVLKKIRGGLQLTQLPQLVSTPDALLLEWMQHDPVYTADEKMKIKQAMKLCGFYELECPNRIMTEKYIYCTCESCMALFVARTLAKSYPRVKIDEGDWTDEQHIRELDEMSTLSVVNTRCPTRCGYARDENGYEVWQYARCKHCTKQYSQRAPSVPDKMPRTLGTGAMRMRMDPKQFVIANADGELDIYNPEHHGLWDRLETTVAELIDRHVSDFSSSWFFVFRNDLGWFITEHVFYEVDDGVRYRNFADVMDNCAGSARVVVRYCTFIPAEWSETYSMFVTHYPPLAPVQHRYSHLGVLQQQNIYHNGILGGKPEHIDLSTEYLKQVGVNPGKVLRDVEKAQSIIVQVQRGRIEAKITENTTCLVDEILSLPGEECEPVCNIDFGVTSCDIDMTTYNDAKFRAQKRFFVCDHCQQNKLIQYGNDKHHVCYVCYVGKSRCDFCTIYYPQTSMRWYRKSLLHYFKQLYIVAREKAISFLKHVFRRMATSPQAPYVGEYIASLISEEPREKASVVIDPLTFRRNMETILSMSVETNVCQHEKLMECDDVGYADGEWCLEDIRIPLCKCKRDCWLGNSKAVQQYTAFCERFINRSEMWMNSLLEQARLVSGEQRDSVMRSIPLFCRPRMDVMEWCGDKFTAREKCTWAVRLKICWDKALMSIGVNPTAQKLKILMKCVVAVLGGLSAFIAMFKLTKFTLSGLRSSEVQSAEKRLNHFTSKLRKTNRTYPVFKNTVKSQSAEQFEEALYSKLAKNTLLIILKNENKQVIFRSMGFVGRIAALPKHYYEKMRENKEKCGIFLNRPAHFDNAIEYIFDENDFILDPNTDLAVFIVPKSMNLFLDIRSYVATQADLDERITTDCALYVPSDGRSVARVESVKCSGFEDITVRGLGQLKNVIKYNHSKEGDCGSILLQSNTVRPICAMHVAGSTSTFFAKRGYGVPLINTAFDAINGVTPLKPLADDHISTIDESKIHFPDGVVLQSLMVSDVGAFANTKSKIRKSQIHGYSGEVLKKPAYLSHHEDGYPHAMSPLVAGVCKHGKLTGNFSTSEINEVGEALYTAKYKALKPLIAQPVRLTHARAISSLSVTGYPPPLDLSTSVGFPFALTSRKTKSDYIVCSNPEEPVFEKRVYVVDRPVVDHLFEIENQRRDGCVPLLPYIDCLKDELKTLEKREKLGGTRVFCIAPLSTTIADRQNFIHFSAAYTGNRLSLQHGVGMSMDGPEWTALANYLLEVGDNMVCADYSNFGPGYNAMVNARGNQIIADWTKANVLGVSHEEIDVLCEEHFNSLHMATNLIYRQLSGGPSGSALTVVRNGLVNELYLLLAWRGLYPIKSLNECSSSMYTDYFNNVRAVTYGDDLIMSVSDEVVGWFNGVTIADFLAKYKIVATDAQKEKGMVEYRSITESVFLKRGFVPHPLWDGEWLAPLDLQSIMATPDWIRNSADDGYATWENAKQAVENMYGHGEEKFNAFRELVNQALIEVGLNVVLTTWHELDRKFFPKYYAANFD